MVGKTKLIIGASVLGACLIGAGSFYASTHTNPWADTGNFNYAGKNKAQIEESVTSDLASASVTLVSGDKEVSTTLGELGVQVKNVDSFTDEILDHYAFWKVGNWGKDYTFSPEIIIDDEKAMELISAKELGSYPASANIVFSEGNYVVTPGVAGQKVSPELAQSYTADLFNGKQTNKVTLEVTEPAITTVVAEEQAAILNNNRSKFSFDIGGESYNPGWGEVYNVTQTGEGFDVKVKEDVVKPTVDEVAASVNRDGSARHTITDSAGQVLKVTKEGASGRELKESADEILNKTVAELTSPEVAPVVLNVDVKEIPDVATSRRIEVDISEQRLYLFENEEKIADWAVSSGAYATPTDLGQFRARAFLTSQTMRGDTYIQPDVPWVIYYNGDEAIHGAYWHNQFGTRRSHGCVNLPVDQARQVYDFAYVGMEVWVHE